MACARRVARVLWDARLGVSLYEYAAGFLWGGFQFPLSASSKVYQVLLGFIMLLYLWERSVSHRQKMGILTGASCQIVGKYLHSGSWSLI